MDAQKFKAWRKALGLSQAAAGESLGVARETIVRWEAGEPMAHERMLELACWAISLEAAAAPQDRLLELYPAPKDDDE